MDGSDYSDIYMSSCRVQWHPNLAPGHVLYNLFRFRLSTPHHPLYPPAPFLRTFIVPSIMDSDALEASNLCSVYQPLDVLRLELQNEPAFSESSMPKDDHTLTFVPSTLWSTSTDSQLFTSLRLARTMWHTGAS